MDAWGYEFYLYNIESFLIVIVFRLFVCFYYNGRKINVQFRHILQSFYMNVLLKKVVTYQHSVTFPFPLCLEKNRTVVIKIASRISNKLLKY